ncbi:anti-sigma factor family protein [Amphibacillus sp. Q70]|uniref:anti-sigma factor family protein n=1 Tax=Amphibacillus sp. Q70 TaxID=3453416 RepID=UPI003F8306B2
MTHIHNERLNAYIDQQLSEQEEIEIETHLYQCDTCSDQYLLLLEAEDIGASVSDQFTDDVIAKINRQLVQTNYISSQTNHRKQTIKHFWLAAGLTIVFTLTGLFQGMINMTTEQDFQERGSITAHLLDKSNDFFNHIKGGRHE